MGATDDFIVDTNKIIPISFENQQPNGNYSNEIGETFNKMVSL